MSDRKKIEERLRRKRAEVAALEEKLRAAKVYVSAFQEVLNMLEFEDAGDIPPGKLRPGSAVAQARELILQRGVPVHLDDLIVGIGKPLTQANKSSLVGSLAAYVRQNDIFTRTAPNTFGLIELDHDEEQGAVEIEEPPAGFGRQDVASQTHATFESDLDDDVPF